LFFNMAKIAASGRLGQETLTEQWIKERLARR